MHAKDLLVNDGAQREVVEDLGAVPPDVDAAILAKALIVEAVHLSDLPGLMVSADQSDAIGVADLGIKREKCDSVQMELPRQRCPQANNNVP